MKVLTVNASDIEGGAARAAFRLHQGLLRIGVGSKLLVQGRSGDDPHVSGPQGIWEKVASKVRPSLDLRPVRKYPNWKGKMFSPAWVPATGLVKRINSSDADVVHMHWVNGGMLRIEDLKSITKPIVWSLHDMWPFTGGCHYDEHCGRYSSHCGACPVLDSSMEKDLSYRIFERKRKAFGTMAPMTFVGLSNWMAECARESRLLEGHSVVQLPNPIDTNVFKPVDQRVARDILGLPLDRPLILFGAVNATADPRKGFEHLSKALDELPSGSVELAIFGSSRPLVPPRLGHPMHYLGRLNDDISLSLLYSAADVTVVPSLQENLSNTIVESLACGTPAVAFSIGGNPDMIDHLHNGYLAKAFDPSDLAIGIRHILDQRAQGQFHTNARAVAVERFALERVAQRYLQLYTSLCPGGAQ